jgi:hypothetical protein
MVPAINEVMDLVTTREESRIAKVPPQFFGMLLMIATGSFLVGYDPKAKEKSTCVLLCLCQLPDPIPYT